MAHITHLNGARFRDRSPVEPALNHPEVAGRCIDAQCYHVVVLHHHLLYPVALFVAGLCGLLSLHLLSLH